MVSHYQTIIIFKFPAYLFDTQQNYKHVQSKSIYEQRHWNVVSIISSFPAVFTEAISLNLV